MDSGCEHRSHSEQRTPPPVVIPGPDRSIVPCTGEILAIPYYTVTIMNAYLIHGTSSFITVLTTFSDSAEHFDNFFGYQSWL